MGFYLCGLFGCDSILGFVAWVASVFSVYDSACWFVLYLYVLVLVGCC